MSATSDAPALTIPEPQYVEVAGGRKLAYDEVCPPDPQGTVLLITGLAAKRIGWTRQRQAVGQFYRTIAVDPRDAGDSDPAPGAYTIADMADDMATLLRARQVERAALVGISMGGMISLELAVRYPDLVEKLVLTSTTAGGKAHVRPSLAMTAIFLARAINPSRDPGVTAQRYYRMIMGPGYAASHPQEMDLVAANARYRPQRRDAFRRQQRACLRHDVTAHLDEIHVPTLVVHGERDPLVRVENGRYLAQHIAGARLIEYPRVGHIPIVERWEDYNRDVLAFLAESPHLTPGRCL